MTLGTSPHPLGTALLSGVEAETRVRATLAAVRRIYHATAAGCVRSVAVKRPLAMRVCATVYLLGLAGVLVPAVALTDGAYAGALGLGHVPVAALIVAGIGLAAAGLKPEKRPAPPATPAVEPMPRGLTGLGDLLAQMSHELRTPLNAVIGFSEVMRHELHGPLNARYQEYAIHISESGGRMLKSSQDALAVAEAMTVLLAPQSAAREEVVATATLVDGALREVGFTSGQARLVKGCDIRCERRATQQAIEHLLREAALHAAAGPAIEIASRAQGASRVLVVRVPAAGRVPTVAQSADGHGFPMPEAGGLNVLLARLLLEAQGARLELGAERSAVWSASVTFAAQA